MGHLVFFFIIIYIFLIYNLKLRVNLKFYKKIGV
jgi:hypothetical protein